MIQVTARTLDGWLPPRNPQAHKGDFGKVCIVGGSVGYTGAPVMAARAALRTGSGLVHLRVPSEIWLVTAVKCDEAMPAPLPPDEGELLSFLEGCDAVLVGPGLGRSGQALARRLTEALTRPLVLDADGINALAGHIDRLDGRGDRLTVLTPHAGEFARLLGRTPGCSRWEDAALFSGTHGCTLVYKGHRTVTALPDGSLFENTTGNPGMAKGGSGDVLAGMILSLLGQGLPPERAVPLAVWLHGRAGDLAAADKGVYGMNPTDLIEHIPAAILEVTTL